MKPREINRVIAAMRSAALRERRRGAWAEDMVFEVPYRTWIALCLGGAAPRRIENVRIVPPIYDDEHCTYDFILWKSV